MDYWLEHPPRIEVAGDNVGVTTDRRVVMSRATALHIARALLAAIAQLEDRASAEVIPLQGRG